MRDFLCVDCKADCKKLGELAYMIRDQLWRLAVGKHAAGVICVGCLETRIGRRLDRHDFALLAVNMPDFGRKSARLLDRLGDFEAACGKAARRAQAEIQETNRRTLNGGGWKETPRRFEGVLGTLHTAPSGDKLWIALDDPR